MELQNLINDTPEYGVLTLDFNEYSGKVVINKPVTIEGNNSTIYSQTGPVLTVNSENVILKDLNIEISSIHSEQDKEADIAILVNNNVSVKFYDVSVRGRVAGVLGEEGSWTYPDVIHLSPVIPNSPNQFSIDIIAPISCIIDTDIDVVKIENRLLEKGLNEIIFHVNDLNENTIIFGEFEMKTPSMLRKISVVGGTFGSTKSPPPKDDNGSVRIGEKLKTEEPKPPSVTPVKKGKFPIKTAVAVALSVLVVAAVVLLYFTFFNKGRSGPLDVDAAISSAESMLVQGHKDEALIEFKKLLEQAPENKHLKDIIPATEKIVVAGQLTAKKDVKPRDYGEAFNIYAGLLEHKNAAVSKAAEIGISTLFDHFGDFIKANKTLGHDNMAELTIFIMALRDLKQPPLNDKAASLIDKYKKVCAESCDKEINNGNITTAYKMIGNIEKIFPKDKIVTEIENRIENKIKSDEVEKLLYQGYSALRQNRVDEAKKILEKIKELGVDNSKIDTFAQDIIKHEKRIKSREYALNGLNALNEGDLDKAEKLLKLAKEQDDKEETVIKLANKIKEEREKLSFAAKEAVKKGLKAVADGDIISAKRHLEDAKKLDPNESTIKDLEAEIRMAETNKTDEANRIADQGIKALEAGDIVSAKNKLAKAKNLAPNALKVQTLETRIQKAEAAIMAQARQAAAGGQKALQAGDLNSARIHLEDAKRLAPEESSVIALEKAIREVESAREKEAGRIVAQGLKILETGNIRKAKGLLAEAQKLDASESTVIDLERKIATAETAIADKARKLAEQGLKALGSGNIRAARDFLAQAKNLKDDVDTVIELETQIQARSQAAKEAVESGNKELGKENVKAAEKCLDDAKALDPDEPSIATLAKRIADVKKPSPPPRPSPPGTLNVFTSPWGKIIIDGRSYGLSPKSGISLSPGYHRVTIQFGDTSYRTWSGSVRIQSGKLSKLSVTGKKK